MISTEKTNKKVQKDVNAQWTKKSNKNFYGFENHIKIDSKIK